MREAARHGNREGERGILHSQGQQIICNQIELLWGNPRICRSAFETPFKMSQANERFEHSNWNKRERGENLAAYLN